MHGLDVALDVKTGRLGGEELGAEILRLVLHHGGERAAGGTTHARIVHDLVGDSDLAAEIVPFEHEHAVAGAREVQAGGKARGSAADDDDIVQIVLGHINAFHKFL